MSRRRSICGFVVALVASAGFAGLPATGQATESAPEWVTGHDWLTAAHTQTTSWGPLTLTSQALGKAGEDEIHCKDVVDGAVWNEGGGAETVFEPQHAAAKGAMEGWGTASCKSPGLEKELEELFKPQIEEGKIPHPITAYATAELPLEEEMREAEVCKEGSRMTDLKSCIEAGETERKRVIYGVRRRTKSFPWNAELLHGIREEEPAIIDRIGVPPEGKTCYPKETALVEEHGEVKEIEQPASWTKVPPGCIKITVIAPQIPDEIVFYGTLEPKLDEGSKNGLFPSQLEFNTEAGALLASEGNAPEATAAGELKFLGENMRLLTTKN